MSQSGVSKLEYEEVRIPVPWGHLAGRWYGNRDVRPILAIHGWLDNVGSFEPLLPLLPQHVGYLCVDLPGHGSSSKYPKGIMYHAVIFVQIIPLIMSEYNWTKVSLLGHSLGAMACFYYASIFPSQVDMMVTIENMGPRYETPDFMISILKERIEKNLVADDREERFAWDEPPSFTYEYLKQLMHKGKSINLENCKYILDQNIARSIKFPEKYYWLRDDRLKYYTKFPYDYGLDKECSKNLCHIPYLVVRGGQSGYLQVNEKGTAAIIGYLETNNPHFEMHTVDGTHHVHLNNAKAVADVLCPFIYRHRPAGVNSWTLSAEETKTKRSKKIPKTVRFFKSKL